MFAAVKKLKLKTWKILQLGVYRNVKVLRKDFGKSKIKIEDGAREMLKDVVLSRKKRIAKLVKVTPRQLGFLEYRRAMMSIG